MDFYRELDKDVQEKIDWVVELVKTVSIIPKKYFKHCESTDGLFEIRIEYASNIYSPDKYRDRFFDEGNLVILINAFHKKTQKTPKGEIELAAGLKKQYFIDKKAELQHEKGTAKKNKK